MINRVYPKYHHLKAITIKILTAQYLYVYIAFKVQVMRYLLAYHNWCPITSAQELHVTRGTGQCHSRDRV